MKKLVFAVALTLISAVCTTAQEYMYVWQYGGYVKYDRAEVGDMVFSMEGTNVNICGTIYNVSSIDSITFLPPALDKSGKVVVSYSDGKASVHVPSNVKGVTYSIEGAHVTLNSTNVTDELEYVLEGRSGDGSLLYNGDYKCKFYLNGLDLVSSSGPAIDLECGKRIELILPEGTENRLEDCAGGTHKAALYCDGHLEIEQGGHLTVAGKTGHAISTNEYMKIKKTTGSITVTEAVKDGFHCGQYFQMNGGSVSISGNMGDCIQAELTKNPLDELNGQLIVNGGTLDLTVAGNDVKGLKADRNITISGGDINIDVPGNGSKGISTNVHLFVNENEAPTDIDITAGGGTFVDPETDDTKYCMGIKVDFNMTVEAGHIKVVNTGEQSRGIKVEGTYTNKDGTVDAEIEAGTVAQ